MNKSVLQNIQQALKIMRSEIKCVDDETKLAEIKTHAPNLRNRR